jgi:cellulose biosynthesis protein BcsQ
MTTSTAQALCAGSHLLIPTILDLPSAEAVVSFCEEVERLRVNEICPALNYVGVVAMRTSRNVDERAEVKAKTLIRDALQERNFPSGLMADKHFVRRGAALLSNSEEGIAYLVMGNNARQREIKEAIGELAEEVAIQIGLPRPPEHVRLLHAAE